MRDGLGFSLAMAANLGRLSLAVGHRIFLAFASRLTKTIHRKHFVGKRRASIGDHQGRTTMNTRTRQSSVGLVMSVSILFVSSYAKEAGGQEKKLSPAVGKIALNDGKGEVKGKLEASDPKDASRTECYCKIYAIKLEAGKTYQVDCKSVWDNWLRIEGAKGKQLAEDDDSGGGTDAQIVFECKTD